MAPPALTTAGGPCSSDGDGGGGGGGDSSSPAGLLLGPCDLHSLLQVLCPDFPAGPVHNAWSAAAGLAAARGRGPGGDAGGRGSCHGGAARRSSCGGSGGSGCTAAADPVSPGLASAECGGGADAAGAGLVAAEDFLAAFQVTWLLQPYFLELRATAFDAATKACEQGAAGQGVRRRRHRPSPALLRHCNAPRPTALPAQALAWRRCTRRRPRQRAS
jgi:hypothetical protein